MADQFRHTILTAVDTILSSVTDAVYVEDASKAFDELPPDKLPAIVITEGPTRTERTISGKLRYFMEVMLTITLMPKPENYETAREIVDNVIYEIESNSTINGTAVNWSHTRTEQPIRWRKSNVIQDNVFTEIEYRRDF